MAPSSSNKPSLATAKKSVSLHLNAPKVILRKRTVVVLGVERGGTSMAAGVVRALGINMGQRAGLNHEDPLFLTDETERLKNRIKMRNNQEDVWGFKVPKASMMLDFYEKHLRNPFYVVVYRNPVAIVDSWLQRGAENNPLGVMDRILAYQNAIFEMMKRTRAPILMLNYERALQNDSTRAQAVADVAEFVGIDLTDDLLARAMGMMTGDGRGYVNLPEHFFAAAPASNSLAGPELAFTRADKSTDSDGWTLHEKIAPRVIYTPADGGMLPKAFLLDVDFDDEGRLDLSGNPLRIYFNFIGEYFPGHCVRPAVNVGTCRYLVETSGQAKSIAFGPMEPGVRFKIAARFYELQQST